MATVERTTSDRLAPISTNRPRSKTLAELAPCFTPFGREKVFAEGSVFEMPSADDQLAVWGVVKRSPDQQRVTAINKILVVPDQDGDEVWVVPEQPGKEDRSKRFRLMQDRGLEISLFNGSVLQAEYDLDTGQLRSYSSSEHTEEVPTVLPPKELSGVLDTMSCLVSGVPLELTTLQSLVNFPRDHKLEAF